ncbi:MAG: Pregnancy-associated plasma protein-A [Chitinophagaceae bacterium]|nr:Pregnancy-associated plasma protein-A [Chitinophagaceae bacterium]
MRKFTLFFATSLLITLSCNKSARPDDESNQLDETVAINQRSCASNDVLIEQLKADPSLQKRMDDIESFTRRMASNPAEEARLLAGGIIEIPVVVNVLYKTSSENISQAQIQSQIDVLNEDFAATNTDYNKTPSIFQAVRSGNVNVRFVLDQIIRKSTSKRSWGTNDAMKKTSGGGIAPTSPTTKLNLWSCNLGGGILGYAQFPGGSSATDGVVVDNNAFGRTGTVTAPYHKGRTATHEVGHWMNLRHIWGDANCGNDQVGDTPQANTANFGCPSYPHYSTCTGTPVEMTMNYMDYTDDACMYMFSAGQKTRMLAVFAAGGPRVSFAQ